MIVGGYILKPRIIQDSDISDCSPCVRETWDYLIREENHKGYKRGGFEVKRGQLFRSYDQIIEDLSWNVGWRKESYTKNQMKQAMKNLRDTGRIDTQKKPGGVLITICKYSFYQDPKNYEQTNEETNEQTIDKPSTNHRQTSHIYKNEKNVKNEKNIGVPPSKSDLIEYFTEKGDMIIEDIPLEAENFITHYEDRDWKKTDGKKIKEWKRQAGTWNNNYKKYNRKRLNGQNQTMSYHQEL